MSPEKTPRKQRVKGKPWKPGQSGNPAGRPAGSGLVGKLREAVAARAPELVEALIAKALEGDTTAARVLLDRVLPVAKSEALPVSLPGVATGTLTERAESALKAVGNGTLAPDTATSLVATVGALARIRETEELEARIRALEERTNEGD